MLHLSASLRGVLRLRPLASRPFASAADADAVDEAEDAGSDVPEGLPMVPMSGMGSDEALKEKLGYGGVPIRRDWRTYEPNVWTPWLDWNMKRDFKRRQLVEEHGEDRTRYSFLAESDILPEAVRDEAREMVAGKPGKGLPRYSDPACLKRMCNVTARTRGNVYRYRVSRFIYRDQADHGKISGTIRAVWD